MKKVLMIDEMGEMHTYVGDGEGWMMDGARMLSRVL